MEPRAEIRLNVLRQVMHVLRYGAESRKPTRCIKTGNACINIWSLLKVLRLHVLRYGTESMYYDRQ